MFNPQENNVILGNSKFELLNASSNFRRIAEKMKKTDLSTGRSVEHLLIKQTFDDKKTPVLFRVKIDFEFAIDKEENDGDDDESCFEDDGLSNKVFEVISIVKSDGSVVSCDEETACEAFIMYKFVFGWSDFANLDFENGVELSEIEFEVVSFTKKYQKFTAGDDEGEETTNETVVMKKGDVEFTIRVFLEFSFDYSNGVDMYPKVTFIRKSDGTEVTEKEQVIIKNTISKIYDKE